MAGSEGGEYRIEAGSGTHQLSVLSMGNPHAVLFVDDVDTAPVQSLGPGLERASAFPERCNIGFAQVVDRSHMRLRVWERGVGETQACGSGACAAMVAARTRGLVSSRVKVELPGGCLEIQWHKAGSAVMMTGEAKYAYQGTYHL